MRVLVACEFSGIVREAFAALGHIAWSCDLLPTELPGKHICGDVRDYLSNGWDLMVGHPPCTYLAVSGARWWKGREIEQEAAIEFVATLYHAPIEKVAIENPIGALSKRWAEPDQIIQPYWFGHPESKATCLWLKNLPTLKSNREEWVPWLKVQDSVHREPPSPDRWKNRARTFQGIASAMAAQWGGPAFERRV